MEESAERLESRCWAVTSVGNQALDRGDMPAARHHYEDALLISERLFDAALSDADAYLVAPMTYNIAAHNLAEFSSQNGESEAASQYLERAMKKLLATAENPALPRSLRVNCGRHLPRAVVYFDELCPDANQQANIRRLIARASVARDKLTQCVRGAAGLTQGPMDGRAVH